jgi:hypothetical protein
MQRKPIYHKDHEKFRICSFPDRLWQLQACFGKGTRELDGWQGLARPTDFETARSQLETRAGGSTK